MISRLPPSLTLALSQIVLEGSAFLRNLILARLLGAEQMGLAVALALGVRALEMLGDFGLERFLVQIQATELPGVRGTVHLVQVAKGFVLMGIAALVAAPLCMVVNPALDPAVFILASSALVLRGFINCDYRERQRNSDFSGLLYVEGISNLVAVILVAPIAMATQDYSALAWGSVLQAALLCLLSHLLARRAMSFVVDGALLRNAFKFGIPIACNGMLMFLAMQGDRLIVAMNFSPEDLAMFAISAQLTLLPALIGARFLLSLDLPRFSKLRAQPAELRRQYGIRLKWVVLAAVVMLIAFSTLGTQTVAWLYGVAFAPATDLMTLLAAAASLRLIRAVPNTLLLSKGKTLMMLACNAPRLLALLVALGFIANGYGLVTVVAIGMFSEALSLLIGMGAVATMDRNAIQSNLPLPEMTR
jgi:O-antigen/teichoic acid export membrane protein